MSGASSVVAFEGELNAIVKEYLDFSGFDDTFKTFEIECEEKSKPVAHSDGKSKSNNKLLSVQNKMLDFYHEGKRTEYFDLWTEYLPENIRNNDTVAEKLEFYLNIFFAIYLIKQGRDGEKEAVQAMNEFKRFLETRGAKLSQTTEFLPFYALPFIPNPQKHPSYKELFSDTWVTDLDVRLEKFLTLALKSTPQPRLFELYRGNDGNYRESQQTIQRLQQQMIESDRKVMSYVKRHNKVQADYHNLIGITADLVDSLEKTVQGDGISPDHLQRLCERLFTSHMMPQSVDLSRPGTAGDLLRASVAQNHSGRGPGPIAPLDYSKVKDDLARTSDRDKCLLLQALRWRLTLAADVNERDAVMSSYIQNDLLGCTSSGTHREAILALLVSSDVVVKQYSARLLNAFASLCIGRSYLAQNQDLLQGMMGTLRGEEHDAFTQEMVLGALQKLSLRRNLQTAMIDGGVIEWLIGVLDDHDSMTDYTLEYSVALLMNLCLRTSGKKKCAAISNRVLRVLSDLLGHENLEIRPYVNGALYSILAIPSLREEAKAMGMEEILKCFVKEDQPDMNRQIDFIIKQLNSDESGDEYESDDEEDEEEEEEQDAMEADLDKAEILKVQSGELSGESLLINKYPGNISKAKKRHTDNIMAMDQPLQRPVTPGQRRAAEFSLPPSRSASQTEFKAPSSRGPSRPGTGGGDVVRPPTRSGSRPNTQENERQLKSAGAISRSSRKEADSVKPSQKAMDKLGSGADLDEYTSAFSSKPRVPRTPEVSNGRRPASRGSLSDRATPKPKYSESGPRPSSAGKSAPGSPRKTSQSGHGSNQSNKPHK